MGTKPRKERTNAALNRVASGVWWLVEAPRWNSAQRVQGTHRLLLLSFVQVGATAAPRSPGGGVPEVL